VAVSPDRIHALVVGIEAYAMPECQPLNGPAHDAVRFTNWLTSNGVPDANIRLFLSPKPENAGIRPDSAQVKVEPATQELVWRTLTKDLVTVKADLFFFFWGGHGVSDAEGDRYLFYADATKQWRSNLALMTMLTAIRSTKYSFARQVCFVDACATFVEGLRFDSTLPIDRVPWGDPGGREQQFTLLAASDGQAAKNIAAEQTGALSREVLGALTTSGAGFPPDPETILATVAKRFDELRTQGKLRQIPRTLRVLSGATDDNVIDYGREIRDAVGGLVGKLYDRSVQDSTFYTQSTCFRESSPGVELVLVYGETYEAHPSMTERLMGTYIRRWASERWGQADGTVRYVKVQGWPTGADVGRLRTALRARLCTELESKGDPEAGAYDILSKSRMFTDHRMLAIEHRMALTAWEAPHRDLLRWYVEEFWGGLTLGPQDPYILIFIHIICDECMAQQGLVGRLFRGETAKIRLTRDLTALAEGHGCVRLVLDELQPLTQDDITEWFTRYIRDLAGADLNEVDAAGKIWKSVERSPRRGLPRTDQIERLLIKAHEHWTQQAGKGL
jgi:hypothetical protein